QWLRPGRRLAAGHAEHPLADLPDDAGLFRDWNEFQRRNFAPLRVLPAQERFESNDGLAANILLRLVDEPQLAARDRVGQIVFQHATVAPGGAPRRLEISIGPASFGLGAGERGGAVGERRLPVGRVLRTTWGA